MQLFHKFQSKTFQFALDVLAHLSGAPSITKQQVAALSRTVGLEYPDQVIAPLVAQGILVGCQGGYQLAPEFIPFHLPMSQFERDYLSFVLELPLCGTFLDGEGASQLVELFPPTMLIEEVQRYAPRPSVEDPQISPHTLHCLLQGAQESRTIEYGLQQQGEVQSNRRHGLPHQLEYNAYDQQWHIFLYDPDIQKMDKYPIDWLQDIRLCATAVRITQDILQKAMDDRLAPLPITLTVSEERGALERCFLAFQHREFIETRQLDDSTYQLSFRYDLAEEEDILHRLLFLGPCVGMDGPPHLRGKLLALVTAALSHCEAEPC